MESGSESEKELSRKKKESVDACVFQCAPCASFEPITGFLPPCTGYMHAQHNRSAGEILMSRVYTFWGISLKLYRISYLCFSSLLLDIVSEHKRMIEDII